MKWVGDDVVVLTGRPAVRGSFRRLCCGQIRLGSRDMAFLDAGAVSRRLANRGKIFPVFFTDVRQRVQGLTAVPSVFISGWHPIRVRPDGSMPVRRRASLDGCEQAEVRQVFLVHYEQLVPEASCLPMMGSGRARGRRQRHIDATTAPESRARWRLYSVLRK